jgi:MFS family permease
MFRVAGIPGLALALVFLLTVREPARGAREEAETRAQPERFWATLGFLGRSRTYLCLLLGSMFMGANAFAAGAWSPTFLQRVHGMNLAEIAATIGPVRGLLSAVGILAGGVLIDRLGSRHAAWRMRLPALACMLVGPAELLFLLGSTKALWLTGFGLAGLLTFVHQAPLYAAAVNVARVHMRAVATAVLLTAAGLFGQVAGPAVVGMLNDHLAPIYGDLAIRYSLLIIAVTPMLAGMALWRAAVHYAGDMERAAR